MQRSANILCRQLRSEMTAAALRKPLPRRSIVAMPASIKSYSTSSDTASTPSSEPPPPQASTSASPKSPTDTADAKEAAQAATVNPHEKALAERESEIAQLKNALMTEMANFSNLQKQTAREKAAAREYGIQKFAEQIVANLDVLQMALNAVPETKRQQAVNDQPKSELADLWTGVQMTMKELESTLKRNGVTPFDPVGEKFDPNKHEAMYQVEMPDKTPGTVFQCSQKGWMMKNRLLRPAQVGVVKEKSE